MRRTHTVRRGECLLSIAEQYGFAEWKPIYDASANAELKRRRRHPPLLAPGDVVVIPEAQIKQLKLATGALHRVIVARVKASVRIAFTVPRGTSAEIAVGTENLAQKVAPGDAVSAPIAAALDHGQCTLALEDDLGVRGLDLELGVGELHAPETTIGIQARLANLGHYYGAVDGVESSATAAGVARFQAHEGLPISGAADADTIERLRRAHDGEDAP